MPRKKLNGYVVFVRQQEKKIRQNGTPQLFRQLCQTLGDAWAHLPTELKQAYKREADKLNQRRAAHEPSPSINTGVHISDRCQCLTEFGHDDISEKTITCFKCNQEHHEDCRYLARPDDSPNWFEIWGDLCIDCWNHHPKLFKRHNV